MIEFLLRRVAQILPTLLFVSMLIFGLQQLLPGDPAKILAGEEQDPTVVAYLREKLHLDEPLPVRYAYWVGGVLKGDLGESIRTQQPVTELVLQKLPVTIQLAGMAMVIALLIGKGDATRGFRSLTVAPSWARNGSDTARVEAMETRRAKPKPRARLNHFTLARIHALEGVTVVWVRGRRSTGLMAVDGSTASTRRHW